MTIIFAFKGPAYYLQFTAKQAALASKRHRVICLADEDPAPGYCEWYKWDDYTKGLEVFKNAFKPGYNESYERLAFDRHKVIQNFCKAKNISRYFHADWDVIITEDLGRVLDMYSWVDFTISYCKDAKHYLPKGDGRLMPVGHTGHAMITLRALNKFLAFAEDACNDRVHGCEMLIWTEFAHMGGMKVGNTADVLDHNLGTQLDEYHNVEINGCRYKWIDWENGGPFKVRFDGRREYMPVIHCWSGSKMMIPEWCERLQSRK